MQRLSLAAAAMLTAAIVTLDIAALTPSQEGRSFIEVNDQLFRAEQKQLAISNGIETVYTSALTVDGVRLRAMISRPLGTNKPLKPLLFTQWVSCGSLEFNPNSSSLNILANLARESGLALVRIERSGSGDSEGVPCEQLDYDTEVSHYIDAFDQLLNHQWLNKSEVAIYGSSLGSTTAPLVAVGLQLKGHKVNKLAVQGGGSISHLERMINFDRIYLERRPNAIDPREIHEEMQNRIVFQTEYLVKGRHPDDIAKDSEAMARVRSNTLGLGEVDHYGRPYAWHQQAAKRDFLEAWLTLDADVLVIFNEFDQYESLHGHALTVEMVNRANPGRAILKVQPNMGHSNWRYQDKISAYLDEGGTRAWQTTASELVSWFKGEE